MPIIAVSVLNQVLDSICQMYARALGSTPYGIGNASSATYGSAQAAAAILTDVLAAQDPDVSIALVQSARDLSKQTDAKSFINSKASTLLNNLQNHVTGFQLSGVRTIDDYLKYLNVGAGAPTYWQSVQHPSFYDVYLAIYNNAPSVQSLYYPVTVAAGYTNALGKFVGSGAGAGTFTQGGIQSPSGVFGSGLVNDGAGNGKIDTTKYAGGVPQVNVSSLAGSGVVTVTGDSYDPTGGGTISTGKTWTATVTGNGVTALASGGSSPAPSNSLITRVTNITVAVGITGGTIYAESAAPAGRLSVP